MDSGSFDLPARYVPPTEHIGAEEVELMTPIGQAYEMARLDDALRAYAQVGTTSADLEHSAAADVEDAFGVYAERVAELALTDEGLDTAVIGEAFTAVADGMTRADTEQQLEQTPRSWWQTLLRRAGVLAAEPDPIVRYKPYGEAFWQQVADTHRAQTYVRREPGESDTSYAARHIQFCLARFQWVDFSDTVWYTPRNVTK